MARNKKVDAEVDAGAGEYDDILNRQWGDIPEVSMLPSGSWVLKAKNATYKAPTENGNAKVLFFFIPKEPMDDVSEQALADLGADYDFASNQIVYTQWIEGPRDWAAVRDLLGKLDVDMEGLTIQQSLKAVKGHEVVAFVDERSYTNRSGQSVTENTAANFTALSA